MFKLLRFLKPYWFHSIILVLSVGVQAWFTLLLPARMAVIVNDGISAGNEAIVWATGLEMLIYALISAGCALLSSFLSAYVGAHFSRDLCSALYTKILTFSVSEIDRFSTASLITRTTNDVSQVQRTVTMMLSMMLRAPMMATIAIIQAVTIAPDMTWIIVLAVGVLLFSVITIMSLVIPKFKIFQKLLDHLTLLTRENLTGLRVIRAFNNEDVEGKKFARANHDITKTMLFINRLMSLEAPLMTLVFNGTTVLCIWIGVALLETDLTYLGSMMAFVQYATQVIMSFLFLTMFFIMLPRATVSAKRINEVLGVRPKIRWKNETIKPENYIVDTPSIEFKHVSFAYEGAESDVLTDVSFSAKAGETVAFIGSTGSGKSTLVNLIPRFFDVTKGAILVDGIDLRDYSEDDLIAKIGYVPQRGRLFRGSVSSNIAFGNLNATPAEIEEAARVSQSTEFIKKFDEAYEHPISQGGTNVSGGQKQRLSIARALAKHPEIYIFDDSFSALDMKTDAKLREDLKPVTKNAITLIVAQRVSTIKHADQIIVLDQGKMVGRGSHYELLGASKIYQEITRSQLSESEFESEMKTATKININTMLEKGTK